MQRNRFYNGIVSEIKLFIFIFYSVYRSIIMHEALLLNTKKLIAQNLPYFYQNSLKIFINLTDCWKKIWQLCSWFFDHILTETSIENNTPFYRPSDHFIVDQMNNITDVYY